MSITITAATIAQNEAPRLPALFVSLAWADEIVLVDGGSQDGTAELAQSLGARVLRRPFRSFGDQRNAAMDFASGDWVLFVDADERATAPLEREVRAAAGNGPWQAYRVPVRSAIFGRRFRFSGTQDDRPIRLLRRGRARWSADVHERAEVDGPVGTLSAPLQHETLPDLEAYLTKMRRYTSLAARERVVAGQPPSTRDAWLNPLREISRRLIWKQGWLDGPRGWAFCLLSGLSEWVLADTHRRLWAERDARASVEPERLIHPSPGRSPGLREPRDHSSL